MGRYAEAFDRSLHDPDGFWGEAARDIDWYRSPSVVLDGSARPKGVVRDNGGHAVALRWTMANIYDTGPGRRAARPRHRGVVAGRGRISWRFRSNRGVRAARNWGLAGRSR